MLSIVSRLGNMFVNRLPSTRLLAAAVSEPGPEKFAEFKKLKGGYRTRIPKPPGKYKSVFSMFYTENSVLGVLTTVQLKRIAKLWNSLSEEEKEPYRHAYWKHQSTLDAQTLAFKAGLTTEQRFALAMYKLRRDGSITRQRMLALSKLMNEPETYPLNAFKFFVDEHYKVDGRSRTEDEYEAKLGAKTAGRNLRGPPKLVARSKELAKKWRNLPKDEKQAYQERHDIEREQKLKRYDHWRATSPKDYIEEVDMLRAMRRSRRTAYNTPEKIWCLVEELERLAGKDTKT